MGFLDPKPVTTAGLDAATAAKINTPASATATALSATILDTIETPIADAVAPKLDSATAAASYAPLRLTLNPALFPKLRVALSKVRAGTADAKILCVGDSTTSGIGAAGTEGGTPNSFPYQIASQLNSYIPTARGLGIPPSILAGNPDSRWTAGAGWSLLTLGWGEGADYVGAANAAGSLVYADPVLADRYDVYYATNSGLGTITAVATGGSTVNQSTSAAGGVGKVTVSAASAATTNTITLTNVSGAAIHILAVEPWHSTVKRVRVGNAGVGSSTTTKWVQSEATFGGPGAIRAYAPDLTILSLGINDATNAVSVATFMANMQLLINAAKISGDILIMSPFPSASGALANQITWEPQYAAALKAGTEPYLDLFQRFGQPGTDTTFDLNMMNDQVHPNAMGYADLAQLLTVGIAQV